MHFSCAAQILQQIFSKVSLKKLGFRAAFLRHLFGTNHFRKGQKKMQTIEFPFLSSLHHFKGFFRKIVRKAIYLIAKNCIKAIRPAGQFLEKSGHRQFGGARFSNRCSIF